jgi:hypothetical protein
MKKIYCIILAAAAMVACTEKLENQIDSKEGKVEHKVFVATNDITKTELVAGNKVYWLSGDAISIFDGTTNERVETTDSGESATFEVDLENGSPWYALYPYDPNAVISGSGNITTTLPAIQRAKAGSFADELNISIAKTTTNTLDFKNFPSYLKFQVPAANIKRVTIKGANNENIAGKVQIKMSSSGVPIIQDVKSGANVVTLLPPSGSDTFATDTDYFIALFPGTLTNGFWLLFTYADNTIGVAYTTKSADFNRNSILNIHTPTLKKGSDVISFRDPVLTAAYGSSFTVAQAAATTSLASTVFDATYFDECVFFGLSGGMTGFQNKTSLKQIILPKGITALNKNSFNGCTNLEAIVLNDGLTSFGNSSLYGDSKLNAILVPSSVTGISGNAFTNAGNLDFYWMGSTPPSSLATTAFKANYNFYVPSGSKSAYETSFAGVDGTITFFEY